MNQRAAVIIMRDGKILLMHRRKNGREYFAVPGGMVEEGETPEQAAVREAKEETDLDVVLGGKVLEFEREIYENNGSKDYHGSSEGLVHEYFFLADSFSGTPALGGPELERNSEENFYELEWIGLKEVEGVELLPPEAKKYILENIHASEMAMKS